MGGCMVKSLSLANFAFEKADIKEWQNNRCSSSENRL